MKPPRVIKGQRVASTNLDLHGERFSKNALEKFAGKNERIPLHQNHDMSKPTVGYIENFRVEADPSNVGEWVLIADVHYLVEDIDEAAFGGFSISIKEAFAGNQTNPDFEIYLPYPIYNDTNLVESMASEFSDAVICKWQKKGKDTLSHALIVSLVGLVLKPIWEDIYKEHIRPQLNGLFGILSHLKKKNISADFVQGLFGPRGESVGAYFIPIRGKENDCYTDEKIFAGVRKAHQFLFSDKKSLSIGAKKIKLLFNPKNRSFEIIHIEYADGSDANIIQ